MVGPKLLIPQRDLTGTERTVLQREVRIERERRICKNSFRAFLVHWRFINRETGELLTFETLWKGQEALAEIIERESHILALKAGKLGFTEIACAYDAWVALFGAPNTRVHLFSRDDTAAQELLSYVKFGLERLPPYLKPRFMGEAAGGETTHSLKWRPAPNDTRVVKAYSAGPNVSVDQTAKHAHVDELARMPFPSATWNAVYSTIAPGGTVHVISRGAGEANYVAELWRAAQSGTSELFPFFQPWTARPGRDRTWYERQAGGMTRQGLRFFAPETVEEALAGDDTQEFVPIELWDACRDDDLPPLLPGDRTPAVVAMDAAVTGDCFGIVIVTRHPERHDDIAIRGVRKWDPPIRFEDQESFIRTLCFGGCALGHGKGDKREDCPACKDGATTPPCNIIQVAYDAYQLEAMAQRLRKEGVWMEPFPQQRDRLIADSELRGLIVNKRITHSGNQDLRQHILNAAAKVDAREDTRLRIVKKVAERKIDLAVAASMAAHRCLYLWL